MKKAAPAAFYDFQTRAAVRRQVTVVRAAARGAKLPFSGRGPPKKRKACSTERTFANILCTKPYNPKKFRARIPFSRPPARNDPDRKSPRPARGDLHLARSARRGNRGAKRSETSSKKRTATPSSFLKFFTEFRSASRSPRRSSSACSA